MTASGERYCDQCGAENRADARFCWSCGRPLHRATGTVPAALVVEAPAAQHGGASSGDATPVGLQSVPLAASASPHTTASPRPTGMPVACPSCGRDDAVQRATTLVDLGTLTGMTTATTVSRTALAQRLAPPAKPALTSDCGCMAAALIVGACIIGTGLIFASISEGDGASQLAGWAVALVGLAGLGWYFSDLHRQNVALQDRLPVWECAVSRYRHTYYCARCDGVFSPGPDAALTPTPTRAAFLAALDRG